MSHLHIYRGLPASGKSTHARQCIDASRVGSIVRLNRDDLRKMMLPTGYKEPVYQAEELVTKVQQGQIVELLRGGVDVIIDDTNLRARSVRTLAQLALKAGATWSCIDFFDVPVEECLRRDAARENAVGEEVILRMYRKYLSNGRTLPVPEVEASVVGKPYVPVVATRQAVMVDIDGTVALHHDVRDPYDTSKYHLDKPNAPVIEAIRAECNSNTILFCSGRDAEFRDVTVEWLKEHIFNGPLDGMGFRLFMRPTGDKRNDAIVKLELFDEHIRDTYNVRRVYDDRDRVVDAWRSIGLTVLQVAPGAF
jgi:predicted kinase